MDRIRAAIEQVIKQQNIIEQNIEYVKTVFSRSANKNLVIFETDGYVSVEKSHKFNAFMCDKLNTQRASFIIKQPCEVVHEKIEEIVIQAALVNQPAFLPYINGAKISVHETHIDIDFTRELAPRMFKRMALDTYIESYIKWICGKSYKVRNLTFGQKIELADGHALKEYKSKQKLAAPTAPSAVKKTAARPSSPSAGKDRLYQEIKGEITPITDLVLDEMNIIKGVIVGMTSRVVKEKWRVYNIAVSDKTDTVTCVLFVDVKKAGAFDDQFCLGKGAIVKGTYQLDTFAKCNTLKISVINSFEVEARQDTAEEKRVELHLHTSMSTQDATTSAGEYIKRAAQWGHKAIAITDHGVVQAFPEASFAGAKHGVKIIYGMEAYMIDDSKKVYESEQDRIFEDEFVVFDIETTGLNPHKCVITEIGAVRIKNGQIADSFNTFVDDGQVIPPEIVTLTGITQEMIDGAPSGQQAIQMFLEFAGSACLVAHNAQFDMSFMKAHGAKYGYAIDNDVLDTLSLARIMLPEMRSHKLNLVAHKFGIPLTHHRAVNDATATAKILLRFFEQAQQRGIEDLKGLNKIDPGVRGRDSYHTIILCKNKTGLTNLYRLVSMGHLDYFYKKPRIPRSMIQKHREGLIIGSACEAGELFSAIVDGANDAKIKKIIDFYDYVELQPNGNNAFLIRRGMVENEQALCEINKRLYNFAKRYSKLCVATTDTHFLEPEDAKLREIMMHFLGFKDSHDQPPLYFKTTDEMLSDFAYMGEEIAQEIVVTNPNAIADCVEQIELFPGDTVMPKIDGAEEEIREIAYATAREKYGDPLPQIVEERLDRELTPIIKYGFSVLYLIAQKLVSKSLQDGYLVGSRGSVGSSFAAHMLGITDVNPLDPHYLCPKCKYVNFDIDSKFDCGVDMPHEKCPECGEDMISDGYSIPFEVFLGLEADKVPDIDLNFSGEYQPRAHKYVEELFGAEHVFRAGTISSIKDKTAFGYVKKYMEETGKDVSLAEVERLASGITGVKRTTGQHPGGLVIVPRDREVYEFTPIQKPADKSEARTITTHFDFNSMHDILVKLDILGHDNPTTIRMLQDLIGFDPMKIPLNDPDVMRIFSSTESLGITPEDIRGHKVGTLGIPEFGTSFVRQMLYDTLPTTMSELIRISGLSHGTDVWLGNAQQLIKEGIAPLSGCICTRDDIMNYLIRKGVDKKLSFFTMENVRKGKGLTEEMETAMRQASVPQWFVESCKKIKYMFPKAHAVAYVVMALRIAYCKVHYKREYYATLFSVRAEQCDASCMLGGKHKVLQNISVLEAKGKDMTASENDLVYILENVLEMYARGIGLLPVDIAKSRATKFTIEGDNLRMPFVSIPKMGIKAAEQMEQAYKDAPFTSIEDMKNRGKVTSAVIETMRDMGCLQGLPSSDQLSLFEIN